MKRLLTTLLLSAGIAFGAYANDIYVTQSGDTLDLDITQDGQNNTVGNSTTSSSVIGWVIPGAAIISLFLGISSRMAHEAGKRSLLDHYFTNESESDISSCVSEDYQDEHDTDRLSGAWANMEAKMLETNTGEEE